MTSEESRKQPLVVVWCNDCKSRVCIARYHIRHNVIVEYWQNLKHISEVIR